MSGPDTAIDRPQRAAGLRGARPLRTCEALAQLGFADIDLVPAAGAPGRAARCRSDPIRRGDPLSKRGFANVLAAGRPTAEPMKPGALRGAAWGRDLESLPHTLFLRIYPVIGALLLLTQLGIAWVNYADQLRLSDGRAQLLVRMTAAAIARPDRARSAEAYGRPLKALGAKPPSAMPSYATPRATAWRRPGRRRRAGAGPTSRPRPTCRCRAFPARRAA